MLNVYELLLVALGLYLIAKRRLIRDGVMLLVLEAFFVVDVGFLNSELYQQNQVAGEIANGVLLAVVVAKLWLIFRTLKLPVMSARFAVTLAELAALFLLPGVLKRMSLDHGGMLHATSMYASWWLIAGLMAAAAVTTRFGPTAAEQGIPKYTAGVVNFFMVLPLVSLIAHLGTTHWVFAVPFQSVDLSPTMLGTAMLLMSIPVATAGGRFERRVVVMTFILAGLFCVADPARRISFVFGSHAISSTAISLVVAYLVAIYCFAIAMARILIPLGAATGLAYVFGPTWQMTKGAADSALASVINLIGSLMPKSQRQWGVVAMVGSFLLLIVGAWLSLFRGSPTTLAVEIPAEPTNTPAE